MKTMIFVSLSLLLLASCMLTETVVEPIPIRAEQKSVEDNFDELMNLLQEKQQKQNYVVSFVSGGSASGGGDFTRYNITIHNENVVQGPSESLTATDLRDKMKAHISGWTQERVDVMKFDVLGNRCFYGTDGQDSRILCFDDEDNLVYYEKPGPITESWIIHSAQQDIIKDMVRDGVYKARMDQLREEKIAGCKSESCKKFFSLLDAPSEPEYEVVDEYVIKPYDSFNSDYKYVLKYDVENEEIGSVERVEGVYGAPQSESMLKAQLSEFDLSCGFDYSEKDQLDCFGFTINAAPPNKCDLRHNYKRHNCSYCFNQDGYLVSAICTGNGYWKWEK